jgi:hypothetical protein
MPYKVRGKNVYKKESSGNWVLVPGGSHKSHAEALKHLAALVINVLHKGKG